MQRSILISVSIFLLWCPAGARAEPSRWVEAHVVASSSQHRALTARGWDVRPHAAGGAAVYLEAADLAELRRLVPTVEVVRQDVGQFYEHRLADSTRTATGKSLGTGSMGGYFTFDEVVAEMDALQAIHPTLVAPKMSIGTTVEGRSMWAYKLSARAATDEDEPELFIFSLMHAREPIGMMSVIHLATELLAGYGVDPEATYLLEHRELWLIPVVNADGYAYNEATNPAGGGMWRKNRRDNGDGNWGVDLNRNFSYEWAHDDVGSSPNTSSGTYRGTVAFSEPESQALRDFAIAREPVLSINTHAYGDYMIRPWGYEDLLTVDDDKYEDLSRVLTRGTAYEPGNWIQTLAYYGNGDHDAYMYGNTTEKPKVYGFTPEVGNSGDGFWPSTARIQPLVEEMEPTHRFFAWSAGSAPRVWSVSIDDSVGGDGDGTLEPGESAELVIAVRNHGLGDTFGSVVATLDGSVPCVLDIDDPDAVYGLIPAQSTAAGAADRFAVRAGIGATPGEALSLTLRLADDRGGYPDLDVSLVIGEGAVVFADDFELGTSNWTLTGGWGTEPAGGSRTGTALSDSPARNYSTFADARATMTTGIDLSAATRADLVFQHRFWIDNDFDAGQVELSSDGGSSWSVIAGAESDAPSGVGEQTGSGRVYDGHIFDWREERIDLSAWVGTRFDDVRIRFHMLSNGSVAYDGWLIDDIRVRTFGPAAVERVPADPNPLYAVRSVDDVVLSWPAVVPDIDHDPAGDYTLYRSLEVRADAGFVPHLATSVTPSPTATDFGARADADSYAYQVVASNCAGQSSAPPP